MYYSQEGQDQYLEKHFFKNFKNGTFVDVGAHDGVTYNNTKFFAENHAWKGINIEPISEVFNSLCVNRPGDINLNIAISDTDGVADFIVNKGYTEMLSGLYSSYDPRHMQRLLNENSATDSTTSIIKVPTRKLETVFDENNISRVHYLTVDVEGGEFQVIKSINFNKVFIDVIQFEQNYKDTSLQIIEYLKNKGYEICHEAMDVFMIHKNSIFLK